MVDRQWRQSVLGKFPVRFDGAAVDVLAERVGRDGGRFGVLVGAVLRQHRVAPELSVEAQEPAGVNLWQRFFIDALLYGVDGNVDGGLVVGPVPNVGEPVRRVQVGLLEGVRSGGHAGHVGTEGVASLFS